MQTRRNRANGRTVLNVADLATPAPPGTAPTSTRAEPRASVQALAVAGLVALTVLAYARFLGTGFAATDSLPLVETSRASSLADVALQFTRPVMAGTRFVLGEVVYRPF